MLHKELPAHSTRMASELCCPWHEHHLYTRTSCNSQSHPVKHAVFCFWGKISLHFKTKGKKSGVRAPLMVNYMLCTHALHTSSSKVEKNKTAWRLYAWLKGLTFSKFKPMQRKLKGGSVQCSLQLIKENTKVLPEVIMWQQRPMVTRWYLAAMKRLFWFDMLLLSRVSEVHPMVPPFNSHKWSQTVKVIYHCTAETKH